ncbi:MAG TPA: SUF system NifU family Fe-S cluster assembly protein [Bacillota bacterium]
MSFSNLDTLYRQVIMDHYKTPRNKGALEGGTLTVEMNNPSCGDRIQLEMHVEDDQIKDITFDGEGCSISMASASMMTQAVKGKPVKDALEMSQAFSNMMLGEELKEEQEEEFGDIIALQGVSNFPARIDCATLAWKTMEKGVHKE